MHKLTRLVVGVCLVVTGLMPSAASAYNGFGTTRLAIRANNGQPANRDVVTGQYSADGRYTVFVTSATNLMTTATDGSDTVYLKDNQTGRISLVSVDENGNYLPGTGSPSISADGSFIAFAGSDGGIHLYDRTTGTASVPIPIRTDPIYGCDCWYYQTAATIPSISGDGRFIAYMSHLTTYNGPLPFTPTNQVMLYDRISGVSTRISSAPNGYRGEHDSQYPMISGNGDYVTFSSSSQNLVSGVTYEPGGINSYLYSRATGELKLISQHNGVASNANVEYSFISDDGGTIAFSSNATNLVGQDPNGGVNDAYIYRHNDDTLTRVGESNSDPNGFVGALSVSPDGSLVGLTIRLDNLIPGDTNQNDDGVVYDVATHQFRIIGTTSDGQQGNMGSNGPMSITADNSMFLFASTSSDFTNYTLDHQVDLYDHYVSDSPPTYSFDTTAPTIQGISWSTNPLQQNQNTTLSVSASDSSGVSRIEYYVDNDPGAGYATQMNLVSGQWTATFGSTLPAGVYNIGVRAEDVAGNWSAVTNDYLVVYVPNGPGITGKNKKDLVPSLANGDVLPGLITAGQANAANYGFTVDYTNGVLAPTNDFQFTYTTGVHCGKTNAQNCHSFVLNATGFAWQVIDQDNNSRGQFQGTAVLTIDGVTTTNPFTIEGIDGDRLAPAANDHLLLKVFAPGANPASATAIYQASGDVGTGNGVQIR